MMHSLGRLAVLGVVLGMGIGVGRLSVPPAPKPVVAVATTVPALVRIPQSADGHYWVDAWVNGTPIRFLVDTGATGVALTDGDAKRLGYRLKPHEYLFEVLTATSKTRAATVTLSTVTVGDIRMTGVQALVLENGLGSSLLGMNYLNQFSKVTFADKVLTLER